MRRGLIDEDRFPPTDKQPTGRVSPHGKKRLLRRRIEPLQPQLWVDCRVVQRIGSSRRPGGHRNERRGHSRKCEREKPKDQAFRRPRDDKSTTQVVFRCFRVSGNRRATSLVTPPSLVKVSKRAATPRK